MKTILITGANRGLGLEAARRFMVRPQTKIIACCRAPKKSMDLQQLSDRYANFEIQSLDVADHPSIDCLAKRLGDQPIDILINNAGIFGKNQPATTGFMDQQFGNSDFEADWIEPFRTNVIGPMKIVESLIDNVVRSSDKKIAVITSVVGSIAYAPGQMFGYAASKAAANMVSKNLSVALKEKGVIVNPIHPGYAKTDMGGEAAHVEVEEAVTGLVAQIDNMNMDSTGEFLSYDGGTLPW